jgi:hypothetical protein
MVLPRTEHSTAPSGLTMWCRKLLQPFSRARRQNRRFRDLGPATTPAALTPPERLTTTSGSSTPA